MAATKPTIPASTAKTLTIPPRTRDEKASSTPMAPNTSATTARTNPQNAPTAKLAMAATMAMMEGKLNLARVVASAFMAQTTAILLTLNRAKALSVILEIAGD